MRAAYCCGYGFTAGGDVGNNLVRAGRIERSCQVPDAVAAGSTQHACPGQTCPP